MMVVIRCAGMPHSRQRCSARTIERIKKRTWILFIKVPSSYFLSKILNRDLVVWQWNYLTSWNFHLSLPAVLPILTRSFTALLRLSNNQIGERIRCTSRKKSQHEHGNLVSNSRYHESFSFKHSSQSGTGNVLA